jgi:hypothetical protein
LDQVPYCCTPAVPAVELDATVAMICVSLQLTIPPSVLPSQTVPVPCAAPNPVPKIVTCTPPAPEVGVMLVTFGGGTIVNTAVATPLSARPEMYAIAFIVVVVLTVTGPLYRVPVVSVGVLPSVV